MPIEDHTMQKMQEVVPQPDTGLKVESPGLLSQDVVKPEIEATAGSVSKVVQILRDLAENPSNTFVKPDVDLGNGRIGAFNRSVEQVGAELGLSKDEIAQLKVTPIVDRETNKNKLPQTETDTQKNPTESDTQTEFPLGERKAHGFSYVESHLPPEQRRLSDKTVEGFFAKILPSSLHRFIHEIRYVSDTPRGYCEVALDSAGVGTIYAYPPDPNSGAVLTPEDLLYSLAHEGGHIVVGQLRRNENADLWQQWSSSVGTNASLESYMQSEFPIGKYDEVYNRDDQLEELFNQVFAANAEEHIPTILGNTLPQNNEQGLFVNGNAVIDFKPQSEVQYHVIQTLGTRVPSI